MILKSRKVFAACNEITTLSKPLQSRFRCLHLPSYTEEQFLEVSVKVLPKLKIAHVIGKAVWDQRGNIRDVISIAKLVRKNFDIISVELWDLDKTLVVVTFSSFVRTMIIYLVVEVLVLFSLFGRLR
jgi:hypothetical protein